MDPPRFVPAVAGHGLLKSTKHMYGHCPAVAPLLKSWIFSTSKCDDLSMWEVPVNKRRIMTSHELSATGSEQNTSVPK